MKKNAFIAGATGLVGRQLLFQLLESQSYESITALVRRPINISHPRLKVIITNFEQFEGLLKEGAGGDFYCCLGTTIRKAGGQAAFRAVDQVMVVRLAEEALKNEFIRFTVISSIGAAADSRNFYLRTKGQMELHLKAMPFGKITVVRPSILFGSRAEWRFGEWIGKLVMKNIGFLFLGSLKKYRGIEAVDVARAMIRLTLDDKFNSGDFESDVLREISRFK